VFVKAKLLLLFFLLLLNNSFIHGQDRFLDYYIQKGIANSPVLKDISNQIQANQYDSLVARAAYLPQISFNALVMYAPAINGWGYSDVITNGQQLIGTVNVNQQIFNKKTRETNYRKFGIQGMSLENSRKISTSELKKAITAQYLAAYAAFMEKKYQAEVLATLSDQEKILSRYVEQGIYRQTDYLTLRIATMSLERNIRDLDVQFRKEYANLNLICGVRDTAVTALSLPLVDESAGTGLSASPLFKRFYYDSLQILNERELVDRRYKPTVNWFSDGGMVNNLPAEIYKNMGVSIGMSLGLPLYDGNQRKYQYGRIKSEEDTRKNYQEFFRFQYEAQLRQLKEELGKIEVSATETRKQVALITELISQDQALLNIGSLSVIDYVIALRSLTEARHNSILYQIRAQYIMNEINFLKQ
jgi:outer membrane protein TolC